MSTPALNTHLDVQSLHKTGMLRLAPTVRRVPVVVFILLFDQHATTAPLSEARIHEMRHRASKI